MIYFIDEDEGNTTLSEEDGKFTEGIKYIYHHDPGDDWTEDESKFYDAMRRHFRCVVTFIR